MVGTVIVLLLIGFWIQSKEVKKLREENQKLRSLYLGIEKQTEKNVEKNIVERIPDQIKTKTTDLREEQKMKREEKNVVILTTGAGLIIGSALLFLMTTWDVTHDILKTIILLFLGGVFGIASKIARERFGLEKVSTTFFYMAMAYIPICLISISILGLFGEFLSIGGDGRYIYLALSSLLVSLIYNAMYKKEANYNLYGAGLLFQMATIICGIATIIPKLSVAAIGALIYMIYMLVKKPNEDINRYKLRFMASKIAACFIGIVTLFNLSNLIPAMPAILALLAVNFLGLALVGKDRISAICFSTFLNLVGIYCLTTCATQLSVELRLIFVCIYITLAYMVQYIVLGKTKQKLIKNTFSIVSMAFLVMLYVCNLSWNAANSGSNILLMKSYIISIIQIGVLWSGYYISAKIQSIFMAKLIPCFTIIAAITAFAEYNLSYHAYIIFGFVMFIVGELIANKHARLAFSFASHIYIPSMFFIQFISNFSEMQNDAIYYILLTAVYAYTWLKNQSIIAKYAAYVMSVVAALSVSVCLNLPQNAMDMILPVITILIMYMESKYIKLKDSVSPIFIGLYQMFSIICLSFMPDPTNLILIVIFSLIAIYLNKIERLSNYADIVPVMGILFGISECYIDEAIRTGIMLLSTTLITAYSLLPRKLNMYSLFSLIYLLVSYKIIEYGTLNQIITIIWAISNIYAMENIYAKDVYKIVAVFAGISIYQTIIGDVGLVKYYSFSLLGYIVASTYIIRSIIQKYVRNIYFIESFIFLIIYFIGIQSYRTIEDALLAIMVLIGTICVSYIKKYDAQFTITIIGVVLTVISIFTSFGTTTSWWIYLLGFGSWLITFAIRNEINEKNK